MEGYPGLYRDVQTYLKERIREVLTGAGEAIVVRIFGPDLDVLRDKAEEVRAALADVPDLVNLHKELMVEVPHIQVTVKLEEAQRYGLKPGDVRRASASLMAGEEVGDIFLGGRTYDVQVWTSPESRHSVDSVREMLIDTPTGQRVRLAEVADVSIRPTPNVIKREASSRRIDVQANVKGRDLGAVAERRAGAPGEDGVSAWLLRGAAGRVSGTERRPQSGSQLYSPCWRSPASSYFCSCPSTAGVWQRSAS